MIQAPIKVTQRPEVILTTRPITTSELHQYTFFRDHTLERVRALPNVRFLKVHLKGLQEILNTGRVVTFEKD